jgi:hypothetical protein
MMGVGDYLLGLFWFFSVVVGRVSALGYKKRGGVLIRIESEPEKENRKRGSKGFRQGLPKNTSRRQKHRHCGVSSYLLMSAPLVRKLR